LERDAARYGTTLGTIAATTRNTMDDVNSMDAEDALSIYDMAFIDNPRLFVALCERTQSSFRLQSAHSSDDATCYYAADASGVEWTTHPVPGAQ
jgi:hypothetical protein